MFPVCELPSCWNSTRSYLISNRLLICTSTSCVAAAPLGKYISIRMTPYRFVRASPLKCHQVGLEHGALALLQFNLISVNTNLTLFEVCVCLFVTYFREFLACPLTSKSNVPCFRHAAPLINFQVRTRHPCMFLAVFLPSAFNRSYLNISRCESRNRCKVVLKSLLLTEGFSFCMQRLGLTYFVTWMLFLTSVYSRQNLSSALFSFHLFPT